MTGRQYGNCVAAIRAYGKPSACDADSPNPVLGTLPAPDGGTIRVYANGLLDAVDGSFYSISIGFTDVDDLLDWIDDGGVSSAIAAANVAVAANRRAAEQA